MNLGDKILQLRKKNGLSQEQLGEKVDRKLVINFIDEIRIGNNKEIEIDLKFKNQYNEVLDYLKRHDL